MKKSSDQRVESEKAFWKIVEFNHFYRDVLAPTIAAEDKLVRETVKWLDDNDVYKSDEMLAQDTYTSLEQHVIKEYGLPAELSDLAFALCRDMVWRGDFEHGKA